MNNRLDLLIALCDEYKRLLEEYKQNRPGGVSRARLERTALVLRQTTLEFEKGGIGND
ncbi:phage protein [Staphylococcus microti]|uniref:Phage protein n=1 Tax=Staphylococcus microti TaxID=569857 RepID=A0A380GSI3_9STAP|nr:hypothetical protein [Staphylococcus microti]SUM57039.1 phage protein [Staphylococcus microti]